MSKAIPVTFSDELVEQIDEARKSATRSSFIRRQVEREISRHPPVASIWRRLDEFEARLNAHDIDAPPTRQTRKEAIL